MPRFAVGWYQLYEADLRVEIITAENWRDAALKHSGVAETFSQNGTQTTLPLPTTLEAAKQAAFDQDAGLDVKEIL